MTAPNFHCYGPRPAHADLPPVEDAVYRVLAEANGIFRKSGFSVRVITNLMAADGVARGYEGVIMALIELRAKGLAEIAGFGESRDVNTRWRKVWQ